MTIGHVNGSQMSKKPVRAVFAVFVDASNREAQRLADEVIRRAKAANLEGFRATSCGVNPPAGELSFDRLAMNEATHILTTVEVLAKGIKSIKSGAKVAYVKEFAPPDVATPAAESVEKPKKNKGYLHLGEITPRLCEAVYHELQQFALGEPNGEEI